MRPETQVRSPFQEKEGRLKMAEQDNIIELTGTEPAAGEEISRARTSSAKTAAAKKTASKTAAKTTAAKKTAARKTASSSGAKTAAKKPSSASAAKKTTSSAQPRLTAREKKLIQNYRKCGDAGKLMIETMTEKAAEMTGKGSGSDSESGLGSVLSSITQNLDLSSLTGLLGR